MCGRFAFTGTPEELMEALGVVDLEDFPPRYNIAPTQPILLVIAGNAAASPAPTCPTAAPCWRAGA